MSRNLEARIAKLEAVRGKADDVLTVVLVCFGKESQGTLLGFEGRTLTTTRKPGESEDDLIKRAELAELAAKPQSRQILLRELRA